MTCLLTKLRLDHDERISHVIPCGGLLERESVSAVQDVASAQATASRPASAHCPEELSFRVTGVVALYSCASSLVWVSCERSPEKEFRDGFGQTPHSLASFIL